MAYNFKSIADVEVVAEPAESANVLIEEDGVIKKAPKTSVGGVQSDMMIRAVHAGDELPELTILSGTYDDLMQKLENNIPVLVYVIEEGSDFKTIYNCSGVRRWVYDDGTNTTVIMLSFSDVILVLFPDNTIKVD